MDEDPRRATPDALLCDALRLDAEGLALEAEEARRRALSLAESVRDRAGVGRALIAIAEGRRAQEAPDVARAAWEDAVARLAGREADPLDVARARAGMAECLLAEGEPGRAASVLEPAREAVRETRDTAAWARGQALQVALGVWRGDGFAREPWDEALEALMACGLPGSAWRLTMGMARALEARGEEETGRGWLRRARDLAIERFPAGVGPAALAEADRLAEAERLVEADAAVEVAAEAARAAGDREGLARCLARGVDLAVALASPGAAVSRLHEVAALAADRGDERARLSALLRALRVAARAGTEEAGPLADEVHDLLAASGGRALPAATLRVVAADLADAGRVEEARDLLLAAARGLFADGEAAEAAENLAEAARLAERAGDRDLAAEMWDEVVGLAEHYGLAEQESWEAERAERFPGR